MEALQRSDNKPARYIGGHAAAAILGRHPHLTALDVWQKIVEGAERPQTREMSWGSRKEAAILADWSERHPEFSLDISPPASVSAEYPWLSAKPDAFVQMGNIATSRGIVSAKSVGFYMAKHWGDPGTDAAPEYAIIQEQTYCGVLKVERSYFAAEIAGRPPLDYEVEADPEFFEIIVEATGDFWERHIKTATPPPPDGTDKYTKFLRGKFEAHTSGIRPATSDEITEALRLRGKLEVLHMATETLEAAKQHFMSVIGEAEGIDLGNGERITWRRSKDSKTVDWQSVARHFADGVPLSRWNEVVADWTKPKPGSRRFLMPRSWSKDEEE